MSDAIANEQIDYLLKEIGRCKGFALENLAARVIAQLREQLAAKEKECEAKDAANLCDKCGERLGPTCVSCLSGLDV